MASGRCGALRSMPRSDPSSAPAADMASTPTAPSNAPSQDSRSSPPDQPPEQLPIGVIAHPRRPWTLRGGGQRLPLERESKGAEDGDTSSSGGFDDGSDVGVEVGSPPGAEAIRHLTEDDTGPQGLLGAVVGGG